MRFRFSSNYVRPSYDWRVPLKRKKIVRKTDLGEKKGAKKPGRQGLVKKTRGLGLPKITPIAEKGGSREVKGH